MFNLSFSEVFLIVILALVFLKPADLPIILKQIKKLMNKLLSIKDTVLEEIDDLKDDFKELEDELLEHDKIIKKEQKNDK